MDQFEDIKKEKSYQMMMEQYPGMVFIIDSKSRLIKDVNSKVVDFYGYSYEELIGKAADEINTYSKSQLKLEMDLAKRQNRTFFRVVHRTKSGALKNVHVYGYPFILDGKTYMFSGVKEAEQEALLKGLEGSLGDFIHDSTSALCLVNSEDLQRGEIVYVNRSFTRLFRLDPQRFLNEKFSTYFKSPVGEEAGGKDVYTIEASRVIKDVSVGRMTFRIKGVTYSLLKMTSLDYQLMAPIKLGAPYYQLLNTTYGDRPGYLVGIELYSTDKKSVNGHEFLGFIEEVLRRTIQKRQLQCELSIHHGFITIYTCEDLAMVVLLIDEYIRQVELGVSINGYDHHYKFRIGVSQKSAKKDDLELSLRHALKGFIEGQYNQVAYYKYHVETRNVALLQEDIEHGLKYDEFVLYAQPIVDLQKQYISGIELLIRWEHPVYGLIYPNDFLPKAEHSGLITQIDAWVVEKSLELIKSHYLGQEGFVVHVNISPKSLVSQELIPIMTKYKGHEVLKHLILEITEASDAEVLTDTYAQLQSLGISFAIDDFGTGFSSFDRMRQAGVHCVKIDRSFIMNIVSNPDDTIILESVLKMCRNLKMSVVAEGVETKEQLKILRNIDGTSIQGYYFYRPVKFEEFHKNRKAIEEEVEVLLGRVDDLA